MAQREGSALLISFVVALVLLIGASVAFFVVYNEREDANARISRLTSEKDRVEKDRQALNGAVDRLKGLIAGDSPDAVGSSATEIGAFRDAALKKVEVAIQEARRGLGLAPLPTDDQGRVFRSLVEPYEPIADLFSGYRTSRDDLRTAVESGRKTYTAALEEEENVKTDLRRQIDDLNTKLGEAERRAEDAETLRNNEKEDSSRQVTEQRDEFDDREIAHRAELRRRDNEISALKSRLESLESKVRTQQEVADLEPDGRLVRVSPALQKGWIDLGRKDHLIAGLIFRVFQVVKGGKMIYKGQVEVAKVEEGHAEVRVIEEVDPGRNPITDGDYVASPFYDKTTKPIFVLAGSELESKEVTLEFLRAKLGHYGVELGKKVDVNTSYLVALKGYQQSDEYAVARELKVPVLREQDVLEFIGY
jgi:hypothetical protein